MEVGPGLTQIFVCGVALCTQKSTFLHQYVEKYLCIVIFDDAGC